VRERVIRARTLQRNRQGREVNAALGPAGLRRWCCLDAEGHRLLEDASDRMGLSGRGVHRVLKVARTVADLEGVERIGVEHLAEGGPVPTAGRRGARGLTVPEVATLGAGGGQHGLGAVRTAARAVTFE